MKTLAITGGFVPIPHARKAKPLTRLMLICLFKPREASENCSGHTRCQILPKNPLMRPNCMPSFLRKAQKWEDPWYQKLLTSRAACSLPNFPSEGKTCLIRFGYLSWADTYFWVLCSLVWHQGPKKQFNVYEWTRDILYLKRHVLERDWSACSKYDSHPRFNSQHDVGERGGGTHMTI
jgi:hypothetical protein